MRRSKTRGRRGDHLIQDDRTGFTIWASEAQREWNGALVHRSVFEARHPQDFVRGRKDNLTAYPTRPTAEPEDLPETGNYHTYLVLRAAAGDTAITVNNITGFRNGDWIRIALDNGDMFQTRVISVQITIDNFSITIDSVTIPIDSTATLIMDRMPWPAAVGSFVVNISNATHADLTP